MPDALVLFDFDGTITTHETMPNFLRQSVHPRRLIFGQLLLAPWVLGYKLGFVSGVRIRKKLVQFAYRGVRVETLVAAGARFANDYLPKVLRAEAMARIAWHQDQGHRVVVVSGGLDCYLAPWCEAQGLELICSALQHEQGVLTGRYLGLQCVREEKGESAPGSGAL